MNLSPDQIVFWQWGPITINATLVFNWIVTALLVLFFWFVTRKLSASTHLS